MIALKKSCIPLFLSLFLLAAACADRQELPFLISLPEPNQVVDLKVERYNVYHHLHNDLFVAFDLAHKTAAAEERKIIKDLAANLSPKAATLITVPKYIDGQDLVINLRIVTFEEQRAVLLSSNYSFKTNRVLAATDDGSAGYGKLYIPRNGKLVDSNDLFDPDREKRLQAGSPLSLANFYIMDELAENDAKAERLLEDLMKNAPDPLDRYIALLSMGQMQLIANDLSRAADFLKQGRAGLAEMGDDETARRIFGIYEREYEMMRLSD